MMGSDLVFWHPSTGYSPLRIDYHASCLAGQKPGTIITLLLKSSLELGRFKQTEPGRGGWGLAVI
jgi:hypothetical protein